MKHDKYLILSDVHHTELSKEDIDRISDDYLREIILKNVKLGCKIIKNSRNKIYILKMESSRTGAIQNEFRITLT